MKKLLLCMGLSLLMASNTFAKSETVAVDGKSISMDVQERGGRKLYPLLTVCEALGIQIMEVDDETVVLKKGDNVVCYFLNHEWISNESGYFRTDAAVTNINDKLYIPITAVSYMFGYNIDTQKGIQLSEVADFTPPKATYASSILYNDMEIIVAMKDEVKIRQYIDFMDEILAENDWEQISEVKAQLKERQQVAALMASGLKSQSGKAIYKAFNEVIDKIYDEYDCLATYDYEGEEKVQLDAQIKKLIQKANDMLLTINAVAPKVK